MTTIVKAANAAEFLSLVPRLLGFHPTRSLVLVPFAGKRTLGAMRVDLQTTETDEGVDAGAAADCAASTLIGMVCKIPTAEGVAVIAYTDHTFAEEGLPHADLARALERRADACGLRLVDALCVAPDAWGSYLDPDCPAGGWPLGELAVEPAGLADLPDPEGDQLSGATLPPADLAEKEIVARSLLSLDAAVGTLCGDDGSGRASGGAAETARSAGATASAPPHAEAGRVDPQALAAACALDDLPALFEDALTWDVDALAPFDAAVLTWCLSRPALRDIALVEWCGGLAAGDEAFDAQLRWEAGEEYPSHLAMHMWGEGERPDPKRLTTALALVRRVASVAPRSQRPGVLATCGWLSWALGRSTHAEHYAKLACEIEPEHGLGEIIRSFVHAGHLPEWAFVRPVPST